jgi:hypothetical protein
MKESKTITIWLIIFTIIITFIFYFLGAFNNVNSTLFNILSNVYCGAIIGIVTRLCTYLIEKRKNINETFNNCYELYKICYSPKGSYINIPFVIDKMNVIYPKINECLSNYSSFLPARFDEYFKK